MTAVGIIGGTGPEGFGLSVRLCMAGGSVEIGSRSSDRARIAADRIHQTLEAPTVSGGLNEEVATSCAIAILAVPLAGIQSTLSPLVVPLRGKLVVSVVAAIEWEGGRPKPASLASGSVAQEVANLLPESRVTSAFHTLSAEKMSDPGRPLNEDTIVCGEDRESRAETIRLAQQIEGIRAISGGRLSNSYYPEQFVGMMALLNGIHKAQTGLRITDLER
jgi:NADPH-dependent F420 reductase